MIRGTRLISTVKILSLALAAALFCLPALCSEVDQQILSIQQAIESGDLEGALRLIAASLTQQPDEGGLYNLRGIVYARRDQLTEAERDFSRAVRLAPRLTPAWQNLARVCRLQADVQPSSLACAISASQRIVDLKPDDIEARSTLALLFEKTGQYMASLHQLDTLPPSEASGSADSLLRCADLAALGRTAEAMPIAARLAQDPNFSEADLGPVLSSFDSSKAAAALIPLLEGLDARQAAGRTTLQALAVAYEQTHRPREARKTLERVALLDPSNPAHLLELARLADDDKDHEAALGYLGHARDLAPGNPQIHFLFAKVAMELELPVEARASLNRALELDPANPGYNFAMGTVILTTRDAASAGNYFQKFVSARPEDAKGHYALGVADYASGDYAGSKQEMLRVQDDPKVAGGAAYFLGRIARQNDDLPGAAQNLRKAIELMPDYAESHTELARVYMLEERPEQARAELDLALHLDPHSFQANMQLLALYKRSHDPRADRQSEVVKSLDQERSRRAELMLRTVELRP